MKMGFKIKRFIALILLISLSAFGDDFPIEGHVLDEEQRQLLEEIKKEAEGVTPFVKSRPGEENSEDVLLSAEDEKILKEIREGKIGKEKTKSITRFNPKTQINREDNRVLNEKMSVGDIFNFKMCFGNPVRINLHSKIYQVKIGNPLLFSFDLEPNFLQSVIINQNAPAEGSIHTTIWLVRNSDKKAYIFNVTGEPCPSTGLLKYPVEINIEENKVFDSPKDRLLLPSDFLIETTKNLPQKNEENLISVNGIITSGNAEYTSLGVSIAFRNFHQTKLIKGCQDLTSLGIITEGQKEICLKSYGEQKKISNEEKIFLDGLFSRNFKKEPKFIVLDWSQTRIIPSTQEYLTYSSQAETNENGIPTARFNLKISIGKKAIIERGVVYLIVLYEDDGFYQMAEIPLLELLKQLKATGREI